MRPSAEQEARFAAAWDRRRSDAKAALAEALSLRDELEHAADDQLRGRLRVLEASCRWRVGEYTDALGLLLAALELLPTEAEAERATALLDLAIVRHYFGLHDDAGELLLEALGLFEQVGDDHGRADVLNNLGIVFWNRREFEEATRVYRESLELRHRLGDDDGVAACRNNLAKVLTDQGAYDQALLELKEALRGWGELGNQRGLGVALNNVGVVHHRMGDLETAAARFRESLAVKERTGDRQGICETLTHLGRIHTERGRFDEARATLERAVTEGEDLGILGELADAYAATAELYEAMGDHAAALDWFRRYHEAERQLFDERSTERFQALQITFRLARAEHEGATDALTGLANRRSLDRQLHTEFARSRAEGRELSLALMDLDDFKAVNDHFGHGVGDDVLRAIAQLLRDHTRTTDVPARYGGEEFVVVFPNTALPEAIKAAEQLCERVRRHAWEHIHPTLTVTISVGVETASAVATPEELLAAADRHLYRAKHAGKDRVEAG